MTVRCGDLPLGQVRSRRGLWLLALLALHANQELSRESLAAAIWPDSDTARETLRRTLTDLRRALGPCAEALVATNQTICLCLSESNVDVLTFDDLAKKDDLAAWEQAIALYRGPLLEECDGVWVHTERVRRTETHLSLLERVIATYRQRSESAAALPYLRCAVQADPFSEKRHRDLMQTLMDCGELSDAVLVYRRLRQLLRENSRSEPSGETAALYQQIRAMVAKVAPSPPTITQPVLAPPLPPTSRLPRPLTRLLGRESELEQIARSMTSARLVTLLGTGGIGKTRLAIEAASRQEARFADGVRFVDLAPLSDPVSVPRTIATVLEVQDEPGRDLTLSLANALRQRHLLLLLDNCEHLIDACAHLVHFLLTECPNLCILATSRQALRLTGEAVHLLAPLPLPERRRVQTLPSEEQDIASEIARSPALQLFIERAAAVQSTFSVTRKNLGAITESCRRLDGIPLALELAAARVRSLTVEQIASLLGNRLRLLTGGDRARQSRQQSLRTLLDWSYELLDEPEKAIFSGCAAFAGGWTLEAATAVLYPGAEPSLDKRDGITPGTRDSWETLELLDSLAEQSLILVEPSADGTNRYRMLETLREYAREKMEASSSADTLRQRHLRWYLSVAETAEKEMRGPGQAAALCRLAADQENVRQALQEAGPSMERLRLATALFWPWYTHGHYGEGRSWLERALAETPDAPLALRTRANKALGDLCWALGDLDAARQVHERNLPLQQTAADQRGIGVTLNSLGLVSYHQGDCVTATEYYRQSLETLRPLGEPQMTATLLSNLAMPLKEQGRYDEATAVLSEAEALFRQLGNRPGLGKVLHTLSLLAKRRGEYTVARAYLEEAKSFDVEVNDTKGVAVAMHTLGEIAFLEGDLAGAERCFMEALERFREVGAQRYVAVTLGSLGDIARHRGQCDQAVEHLRDSLRLQVSIGDRMSIVNTLHSIAFLAQATGDPEKAARLLGASEAAARQMKVQFPPEQETELERVGQAVREALGDAVCTALWTEGGAMDLDAAAALTGLL